MVQHRNEWEEILVTFFFFAELRLLPSWMDGRTCGRRRRRWILLVWKRQKNYHIHTQAVLSERTVRNRFKRPALGEGTYLCFYFFGGCLCLLRLCASSGCVRMGALARRWRFGESLGNTAVRVYADEEMSIEADWKEGEKRDKIAA